MPAWPYGLQLFKDYTNISVNVPVVYEQTNQNQDRKITYVAKEITAYVKHYKTKEGDCKFQQTVNKKSEFLNI